MSDSIYGVVFFDEGELACTQIHRFDRCEGGWSNPLLQGKVFPVSGWYKLSRTQEGVSQECRVEGLSAVLFLSDDPRYLDGMMQGFTLGVSSQKYKGGLA